MTLAGADAPHLKSSFLLIRPLKVVIQIP
jgi:hypothetical protein